MTKPFNQLLPFNFTSITSDGLIYGDTLNMNFAGAETLDPRITFSRTSNATLTNSAGVLTYAPHNLLTFSEQFDNAAWTKGTSTITANAEFAPNGTTTADFLKEDASPSSFHSCFRAFTFTAETYTFSCYAKLGVGSRGIQLRVRTAIGSGTIYANSSFNLSTGAVIGTPTGTPVATDVGNGWWRLSVSFAAAAGSIEAGILLCDASGNAIFNGDNTSGNYIWGAQLNVGALQPYNPTTVKNLLGFTQEFDNAAWTKSNSTVTANAATAPDGSLTADKLVENTANAQHLCQQLFTPVAGGEYTLSYQIRAAERTFAIIGFSGGGLGADCLLGVNLTTGTITSSVGAPDATSVVPLGGGWYRIRITKTLPAASICGARVVLSANGVAQLYQGDGTSGIYIWGAQISDSASLDPYVYNPVAAPASTAYYGPRFDYDPVTLAPKGLLIEEQRTNLLLRSAEFDDPIWVFGTNCTYTANAVLSPDGTQNADTYTIGSTINGTYQTVAVSASTAYTFTFYVRLGTLAAANFLIAVYNNTAASFIAADVVPSQTPTAAGWTRIMYSFTTPVGCTSVRVYPFRNAAISSGTFSVWGAQLEAGAFPTSYIPTTTAAATRAADVATMIGANFSSWYRQDEGTLFAEYSYSVTGVSNLCAYSLDNGTGNETIVNATATPNIDRVLSSAGGVSQANFGNFNYVVGQVVKRAVAVKLNDAATTANGSAVATDNGYTMPVPTQLTIGAAGYFTGSRINGHVRRITYFPRRLANTELQSITA